MSNIIVRGVLESMIPQAWRWQIWKASKVSSFGILLRSYHRGCSAAAFCGGFWFFGFLVFFFVFVLQFLAPKHFLYCMSIELPEFHSDQ